MSIINKLKIFFVAAALSTPTLSAEAVSIRVMDGGIPLGDYHSMVEDGLSKKDAEAAVKAFVDVVSEELVKGGKVQLVGFGTFEVASRSARTGRNPQTGKEMKIKASKAPKFSAGKGLKDAVNK